MHQFGPSVVGVFEVVGLHHGFVLVLKRYVGGELLSYETVACEDGASLHEHLGRWAKAMEEAQRAVFVPPQGGDATA